MTTSPVNNTISARIVAAAAEHFMNDGFEASSTAAIAKTAKTSKREIYKRFGNKDVLFEQVMAHLCGLVNADQTQRPDSLDAGLQQIGYLVLSRCLQDQTRGILISALGASAKFPELPEIFWREGPGQAVTATTKLLQSPLAKQANFNAEQPEPIAKAFVLECIAPFMLAKLFDAGHNPSDETIKSHIASVTQQLLQRYCH